jgi:superfamily II DNA or RNA helicase
MTEVYLAHLGEEPVKGIQEPVVCLPGTLEEILEQLENRHPGLRDLVLEQDRSRLRSSVLVYKNIQVDHEGRWLEDSITQPVSQLDEAIASSDNLLIAIFNPKRLMEVLTKVLTETEKRLEHADGSSSYRAFMSGPDEEVGGQSLWIEGEPEALYPFISGRHIDDLVTDNLLSLAQDKLVPERLRHAIAKLWELDDDFRLRLFQEDALVHILHEIQAPEGKQRRPLLLSIPTGGGKTEAFLIPLIAHLYDRKLTALKSGAPLPSKVRTLILYPTRALANDQAKRITEILFTLNQGLVEDNKVTIGVLTGDTPNSGFNLGTEKSLLQVCPACSAVLTNFPSRRISEDNQLYYARCSCGAEIDFFRLTRWDILTSPPDILITSPDMINRTLQSPRYHRTLFSEEIEAVVFDEIHMYEGVFGCNVAHLLRRFEEACRHRPLYVGVSATIRNAKELASLIFDADLEEVRYLRPARPDTPITDELRPYIDYAASPVRYRHHYAVAPTRFKDRFQKTVTATLNIADALGHLVRDPHFRKTLIFANFRQDTDDIVRFLRDQEARYYVPFVNHVLPKLRSAVIATGDTASADLTHAEVDIARAVYRWYHRAFELGALYEPPLEIGWHRGGLEKEERIKAVNRFATAQRLSASGENGDEYPIDVMAATKTLELGIDIGDVTTVINNTAPFSVNEYTQRIGRGGRRRDSLALTVVNPSNPLDFYFLHHFDHYTHPTTADFEDAPIIISNQDVFHSHLLARLLDHLAWWLGGKKPELQAVDLKEYRVLVDGEPIGIESDPETFANVLFDTVLSSQDTERLQAWIKREADVVPGIEPVEVSVDELKGWWLDKILSLHKRIIKGDIADADYISGWQAEDRDLVPDMRSAGPQVGVYLIREKGDDQLRDTLARSRAVSSRPVGGFASQGSVTFRIEDIKKRDVEAETRLKKVFAHNSDAVAYFHRMFSGDAQSSPFPEESMEVLIHVDFQTPQDLSVKYHPYRFYCAQCGATYSDKRPGDEHCTVCGNELRQLTEIYVCGGCGRIYLPPVPKVCINPECVAKAKHRRDDTPFVDAVKKVGKYDRHNDYFRFTALPRLKWQCRRCGTEINYHAHYELPNPILSRMDSAGWNDGTPTSIVKGFLYFPEAYYRKNYEDSGWHRARFTCKRCKDAGGYRKIHVTNIPTHRSIVHEYIIHNESYAPPLRDALGQWTFNRVSVISLAREMYRRFFSYADQETQVSSAVIFPDSNSYLANLYDSHAAFLQLSEAMDEFLGTNKLVADYLKGYEDICQSQGLSDVEDTEDHDLESSEMTSPLPAFLNWERERKPDPRRMWCEVVRGAVPGKTCQDPSCEHCSINAFDRHLFVRYLVIHTLKHALIHAMPRFTGVNKNQIRGYIYPNDQREYDLALVDRIVGGSGCLYLLRANWGAIWEMTGELLDAARQDQSQLLLPYTCSRYNRDLCAPLAFEFYKFLQGRNS